MWELLKHRLEESLEENREVRKSMRSGNADWQQEMQSCGKKSENKNLIAPQKEEKYNSKYFNLLAILCLKLTVIKYRHQP